MLGQLTVERLGEQIADHPLCLGAEHVERVRRYVLVGLCLECEKPDLGAVTVRDYQLVVESKCGEGGSGLEDVCPLDCRFRRLAAAQ